MPPKRPPVVGAELPKRDGAGAELPKREGAEEGVDVAGAPKPAKGSGVSGYPRWWEISV